MARPQAINAVFLYIMVVPPVISKRVILCVAWDSVNKADARFLFAGGCIMPAPLADPEGQMPTYRMRISEYDGSRYSGWQDQPNAHGAGDDAAGNRGSPANAILAGPGGRTLAYMHARPGSA